LTSLQFSGQGEEGSDQLGRGVTWTSLLPECFAGAEMLQWLVNAMLQIIVVLCLRGVLSLLSTLKGCCTDFHCFQSALQGQTCCISLSESYCTLVVVLCLERLARRWQIGSSPVVETTGGRSFWGVLTWEWLSSGRPRTETCLGRLARMVCPSTSCPRSLKDTHIDQCLLRLDVGM